MIFFNPNNPSGRPFRTDHEINIEISEALNLPYDFVANNGHPPTPITTSDTQVQANVNAMDTAQTHAGPSSNTAPVATNATTGHHSTIPPPLPPSVEEAYKKKCIELRRRKQEVDAENDLARLRVLHLGRSIRKQRLLKALLLEKLREILDAERSAEEGVEARDGEGMEGGLNGEGLNEGEPAALNGDGDGGAGPTEYNGVGEDMSEMDST